MACRLVAPHELVGRHLGERGVEFGGRYALRARGELVVEPRAGSGPDRLRNIRRGGRRQHGLDAGFGLIAVGLDQIATGSINLRYGRVGQGFSIIEFGVYRATGSETAAFLTPGVLSLGFGSMGSVGRVGALGAEAGGAIPRGGLTMLGGSPQRLMSSPAEVLLLYNKLVEIAKSPTFVRRAQWLGFSTERIAQLPGRITQYYEAGMLGWIKIGGWVDESNLLIGRGGLFSSSGRMRHELGHVLDELAHPGLMASSANPRAFGFMGYFKAEMVAFGTQLSPFNPARPWLAGLTASHNRFGYWGSIPFMAGSAIGVYESERRLLNYFYGQ